MSGSIDDPSSWAPPGLSAGDLWEERSNYVGVVLSSVAYGVHFTLYLIVLQHLVYHPPHRSSGKAKVPWWLVAYITWNFVLGTIGIAAGAKFNQMTFIDDRNFPGGPNGFVAAQYGNFVNIFGTSAYVVLQWFADGLVIYRFWLIYNFNYYVAILPILLLVGSFTMGVILLFQLTQPNANLWTKTTVNFGIPYWSISAGLNILVTTLIVARLMLIRQRTRAVLSSNHSRTYTSVAAMLVESAALYSLTVLLFIITYARGSNIQNLVLPVLGQVQAICPLLIMWRVARGQAIGRETVATTSMPTTSKMSWRNNGIQSAAIRSAQSMGNGNRTGAPGQTQSFAFPTFSKHVVGDDDSTGKNGVDGDNDKYLYTDGDSDSGWELSARTNGNVGPGAIAKPRGVEIVVNREVEQWEDGDARRPPSRDLAKAV